MSERPNILVVDDDRQIARGISLRLEAFGCRVLIASNGAEGLAMARANPPDAIIMDLQMPIMDGFEVLEHLRGESATRSIPTLILSANAVDETRTKSISLGARSFLSKPYHANQLMDELRHLVPGFDMNTSIARA